MQAQYEEFPFLQREPLIDYTSMQRLGAKLGWAVFKHDTYTIVLHWDADLIHNDFSQRYIDVRSAVESDNNAFDT